MKVLRFLFASVVFGGLFAGSITLNAAEENHGLMIVDQKPWKVSWVQKSNQWILLVRFDKGELKTYFKKEPPSKGLGLDSENIPIKQELNYYPSGKTISSKNSQFEQWPDGAKCWAFTYSNSKINVDGNWFSDITTAIIQEVDGKSDEIRYVLWEVF
ncbi:MAG: hypothetical protein Q8L98_04330 [Chlamydiales bacterium]|nr:hypothetical protein [Chlamydiales bacterium]